MTQLIPKKNLSGDQIEIWSKTNDIRKELDYDDNSLVLKIRTCQSH